MDGLGGAACGSDGAVGGVGIGGGDVTGGTEYLAHVLGEVKAVCVPCAVLLDGQRTGCDALRGIPRDEPEGWMVAAREVDAGNLQVASINIALVQCDITIERDALVGAAAHGVIRAVYANHVVIGGHGREIRRAIFAVVGDGPFTRGCFYPCLITIGIELGDKDTLCILGNAGVLVERIRCIDGGVFTLHSKLAVADAIVGIAVRNAIDTGTAQLGAGVMGKNIIHHSTLTSSIAGSRATEGVIAVLALHHEGTTTAISHADEQVAIGLVSLRQRHAVGLGERLQQI